MPHRRNLRTRLGLALALAAGGVGLLVILAPSAASEVAFVHGPYLQNLREDRVTVCWQTNTPAPAVVHLSTDKGQSLRTWDVPGTSTHHEVVLDELTADTAYRYEVRLHGRRSSGGQGRFRTAPPAGRPIDFAVWGDSRSHPDLCQAVADRILASGVSMCLHSGDLVACGGDARQWDRMLFEPAAKLLRRVALWPAIGNHELCTGPDGTAGRDLYRRHFALPDPEFYYSFDYGDAHILVLDSNNDAISDERQYAFAEHDLAATKARWKIVMFHHPLFTAGAHGSQIPMRVKYAPLLARYNVDLIITGHNHNYQLTKPIRHFFEKAQQHPYLHLVSGGGGAPLYEDLPEHDLWYDRGFTANHYVHIHIEGDTLTASVLGLDGKLLDRFTIDHAQPSDGQVYYERIELERILRSLVPVGEDGQPVKGALLDPDTNRFALSYTVPNPLPTPLIVTCEPPTSDGWTVTNRSPAKPIQTIPPKGQLKLHYGFRVTNPAKLSPSRGLTVKFESPVGSNKLTTPPPFVAFRRTFRAAATDTEIMIDGKDRDPAWRTAPSWKTFSQVHRGTPVVPPASPGTTVRLLHSPRTLFVLVRTRRPAGHAPYLTRTVQGSDHVAVYLGSARTEVVFRIDSEGRTHTKPETITSIRSAVHRADAHTTWEIAIPLEIFKGQDGRIGPTLRFNLQQRRRRDVFSLSPTLGAPLGRSTSGYLMLE